MAAVARIILAAGVLALLAVLISCEQKEDEDDVAPARRTLAGEIATLEEFYGIPSSYSVYTRIGIDSDSAAELLALRTTEDPAVIEPLLSRHAAQLELLEEAIRRDAPILPEPWSEYTWLPDPKATMGLQELLLARARLRAQQGEQRAAIDDFLAAMKDGVHQRAGSCPLPQNLLGLAMTERAQEDLQEFLSHRHAESVDMQFLIAEYARAVGGARPIAAAIDSEEKWLDHKPVYTEKSTAALFHIAKLIQLPIAVPSASATIGIPRLTANAALPFAKRDAIMPIEFPAESGKAPPPRIDAAAFLAAEDSLIARQRMTFIGIGFLSTRAATMDDMAEQSLIFQKDLIDPISGEQFGFRREGSTVTITVPAGRAELDANFVILAGPSFPPPGDLVFYP